MLTNESPPDRSDGKRYLLKCEGCSFKRTVEGRDSATRIGNDHHRDTGHEVVAVEAPPSLDAP